MSRDTTQRYTFTQIQQRMYHSLSSIANYLVTFAVVVAHTRQGQTVEETAFLMQISTLFGCSCYKAVLAAKRTMFE